MDWKDRTDEEIFSDVSEEAGSQLAYARGIEIQRRLHLLQHRAIEAQIMAVNEQRLAIKEMRRQSTFMMWSVIGTFHTALVSLAATVLHLF
jgi:hypothetical protein